MSREGDNLNHLINAVIEDSGVAIPQRAFTLVVGLADDGEPVLSERWINLDDLDRAIDEYTKCADIAFVQQGLVVKQMMDNIEDQGDGVE